MLPEQIGERLVRQLLDGRHSVATELLQLVERVVVECDQLAQAFSNPRGSLVPAGGLSPDCQRYQMLKSPPSRVAADPVVFHIRYTTGRAFKFAVALPGVSIDAVRGRRTISVRRLQVGGPDRESHLFASMFEDRTDQANVSDVAA